MSKKGFSEDFWSEVGFFSLYDYYSIQKKRNIIENFQTESCFLINYLDFHNILISPSF